MAITTLFVVSFLDALSFAMVISSLNPLINSLGGSQLYLGALSSVGALVALISSPIIGSLSDSLGRKRMLLQSLFICFIGNIIVPMSESLEVLFVSRTLCSLGTQIINLLKSLIDDKVEKKEDTMGLINKMQALGGAAVILGALLSAHLSEYDNGTQLIFYVISAMFAINFALICLLKDNHTGKSNQKQSSGILQELKNINWHKYWDILIIKLTVEFVFSVLQFVNGIMLTQEFGLSAKQFGYVFTLMSITMIISNVGMMKIKGYFYSGDASGLSRLLHGSILVLCSCFGLGLSSSLIFYLLSLTPMFIGRTIFDSTFTEVLLSRASPEEKGRILGTCDMTLWFGGLTAPIIAAVVAGAWGNNVAALLCSIPLLFVTGLTYRQKNKTA